MTRMIHRRSLHYATPDFLWNLVALVHVMRPSLRKGAHVALSSAAWQEIRVRSVERHSADGELWVAGPGLLALYQGTTLVVLPRAK
jgi:hypothetical protein